MRRSWFWFLGMMLAGAFLWGGVSYAQVEGGDITLEYVNQWTVEGEPALIAVDGASGDVYVNLNNDWGIYHYSAHCEYICLFGREGEIPAGLAVDAEGFVVVAVNINQNYRIVRYDKSGQVMAAWDGEGEVGGIAADAEGRSVVVVNVDDNYRVVRYGPKGEYYPDLADEGAKKLGSAVAIAADPAGGAAVAVNINDNYRVVQCAVGGELLTSWEIVAGVIATNGIAVGANGTVFVNISNSHRVAAYSTAGEYLFEFGGEETAPGEFLYPTGIAIAGGLLYVADSGNHRIQVFALKTP